MITKSRLHLYPSTDIKERAYIVGDRAALLALSEALKKTATGSFGSEVLTAYADNGHNYDIFITKEITEDEWQNMPQHPSMLSSIKTYDEIKQELQKERAN